MVIDKLIAMYYPNSFIENGDSLACYSLYFDEIRLVSMFDGQSDPTKYFSKIPDNFYIGVFGGDLDQDIIDDFSGFNDFIRKYRELIGNVVFYEKHLAAKKVDSMVHRLLNGGLPIGEMNEWVDGKSKEQKIINNLKKKHPEIENDTLIRVVPTALHLSKLNNWQLVSDNTQLPIPYFSETIRNAEQLSSIIAEECLSIFLPKPAECSSQEILEIRDSLSPELEAFRMFMLKAAGMLRAQIGADCDVENLKREATFFVKTNILPIVYELKHRIELEKGKLYRKIFGKIVNYVPITINAFLSPSINNIYKAISTASKDMEDLLLTEHDKTILNDPGIAFLLKIEEVFG